MIRTRLALTLCAAMATASLAPAQSWNRAAIDAHVDAARTKTLAACKQKGIELPKDFLAWVDSDPVRRASVYGCRNDALPVLLGLRSLEIDLGADIVRRDYPQLALAFAIQRSYAPTRKKASGWNDGEASKNKTLPDVSPRPRLQLVVPTDPRVPVDTKDKNRQLDRDDHIINFLEGHAPIEIEETKKELPPLEYDDKGRAKKRKPIKVTRKIKRALVGADVIASRELQQEFNSYMATNGHGDLTLDCGDQAVHWLSKAPVRDKALRKRIKAAHELFHTAYRNKGRMPAERDRAPTMAESMAWLIRNDRHPFSAAQKKALKWPRFPLNAPWPLMLMLASDDQPLREREEIWTRFRDRGEFRTYGEYIGGIAQQFDMQSARRVSPIAFNYGSIQMMWKDGGVCGTMGNIGARTFRICGVPSSTAGQPGHCAIVRMTVDKKTGKFRCIGGQYATGGDEVTTVHAGWNYDDIGGRRPMVFHQTVAWGVNHGLASYVDSLVLRRMWDACNEQQKADQGAAFAMAAMRRNPFALPAVVGAIQASPDTKTATAVLTAFDKTLNAHAKPNEFQLYRTTVRGLVHARMLRLPAPATQSAAQALLTTLQQQGCSNAKLLARTWRKLGGAAEFTARSTAEITRYLGSPRTKNSAKQLARLLKQLARTVRKKPARQRWAQTMLASFAGKEALRVRRKKIVDPAVAELCKLAGKKPPTIGK